MSDGGVVLKAKVPGFVAGVHGRLVVTAWVGSTPMAALDCLQQVQRENCKVHPRLASLALLEGDFAAPAPGVRERSLALQDEFRPHLIATANVVRAKGVGGVIARTFLVGFTLLDRGNVPMQVFRTLDDSLRWLATFPECSDLGDLATLATAIDAFSREHVGGPR